MQYTRDMKNCNDCETEKPLEAFNWRSKAKGTKQPYCRDCQRKRNTSDYRKHREAYNANRKRYRQSMVDFIWEQKQGKICSEEGCEVSNPIMLEFDHLGDKEFNLGSAPTKGYSRERVLREIAKCEIVCANHHRVRTHRRGGWKRNIEILAPTA
jgi:hypothetical protein